MIEGIKISPSRVLYVLGFAILAIVVLSLGGQYFREAFGDSELAAKVISKLNLDEERNNLPTWYQSSTLLLSSMILLIVCLARKAASDKDAKYWGILSAIFLFLSLDEAVSIHEQLTMPLRTAFDLEGFLFLSWVIPAVFALVILAGVFAKFLFRLPPHTRFLLIASGCVYLAGAIGLEMVGANYMFAMGDPPNISDDFGYALITTTEELFEMSGIALFIYSLLSYLNGSEAKQNVIATDTKEMSAESAELICGVS